LSGRFIIYMGTVYGGKPGGALVSCGICMYFYPSADQNGVLMLPFWKTRIKSPSRPLRSTPS